MHGYKYKESGNSLLGKKANFSKPEIDFLKRNEACRIATCKRNIPHVVPVSYILDDDNGSFVFATDYGTRKFENIKQNNHVAITVDEYSSSGNKAVCIQGLAEVIESGDEFARLYAVFYSKFQWVRMDPWKEEEAPFVRIVPYRKVSWGLG